MMFKSISEVDKELFSKRGEGTRYSLIMAGLELFGEYGLIGTSTRMLSKLSGANISAIPYHFGSKEGLYKAVVVYIGERVNIHMQNTKNEIQGILEKDILTREEASAALLKLLEGIAKLFIESSEPKSWAKIIIREQFNPTDAFNLLYDAYMKPIQHMLSQLIATCTGLDSHSDEVKIRGHAFIGQILGFLVSHESILRHLGVKELEKKHIDLIHKVLLAHTQACLKVPNLSEA